MDKRKIRGFLFALAYVCLVFLITVMMAEFVVQYTEVEGMSMYPTLNDKENLILDKITYRFRDPRRYEIVVFPARYAENTYYIKRIIGLPGEEVQILEGRVYIDGEFLDEDGGFEKMENAGLAGEAFVLGEDEYFVLGDNRNNSLDSREPEVGNIRREDMIGRAFLRIDPLSRFGFIRYT